jgi:hypothetical protein
MTKTQAVDLRESNEVLGLLRELKEIDGRWDVDVLRARARARSTAGAQPCSAARKALQGAGGRRAAHVEPALGAAARANQGDRGKSGAGGKVHRCQTPGPSCMKACSKKPRNCACSWRNRTRESPAPGDALARLLAAVPRYYWLARGCPAQEVENAMGDLQERRGRTAHKRPGGGDAGQGRWGALLQRKPAEHELFTAGSHS